MGRARNLRAVLGACERGIVTGEHVDEFIDVYSAALDASGMSVGPAHGFEECGRARGVPTDWVTFHRDNIHADPSAPYLVNARSGATYRLRAAAERGLTSKRNVFLRGLGPHGLADAAITQIHNPFGERLFVALYRSHGQKAFSAADATAIRLLAPHVARAFAMRSAIAAIPANSPRSIGAVKNGAAGYAWIEGGDVSFCPRAAHLFEQKLEAGARKLRVLAGTVRDEVARIEREGSAPTFRLDGVRADFAAVGGKVLVLFYEEAAPLPKLSPLTALLSPQQRRIAASVVAGATTDDIASSLAISRETVRTHLRVIARRFGASTRAELAVRLVDR